MSAHKILRSNPTRTICARVIQLGPQIRLRQLSSSMASLSKNLGAWQVEAKGPITVKENEINEPGPGEVRIKIYAAALQPADAKQYATQVMPRFKYPGILGTTCSGVVDKLGPEVSKVVVGDRVAAGLNNYANGGDPARASHQRYAIAEEYEVVKIGDTLPFTEAVALNTQTPGNALFKGLGLEYPTVEPLEKSEPKNKMILIWGGSSAMGALSIVYAKIAGYNVITTCSSHNVDMVKELGADKVYEREDPELVEKIKQDLPIDFWYDTISLPNTIGQIIEIARAQHERDSKEIKLLTLLPATAAFSPGMPEIPEFLKPQMLFFRNKAPENKEHVEWMMGTNEKPGFIERGIQGGWLRGIPVKSVGGLEKVQETLETMIENKHSGVKFVVEPWFGED